MFDFLKRKLEEWRNSQDWLFSDKCDFRDNIKIFIHAYEVYMTGRSRSLIRSTDLARRGHFIIDLEQWSKDNHGKDAFQEGKELAKELKIVCKEYGLTCEQPFLKNPDIKAIYVPIIIEKQTNREALLEKMRNAVYSYIGADQGLEQGGWDEDREEFLNNFHADLLNKYRKDLPVKKRDALIEEEMKKAEQEYDKDHPNDGRSR